MGRRSLPSPAWAGSRCSRTSRGSARGLREPLLRLAMCCAAPVLLHQPREPLLRRRRRPARGTRAARRVSHGGARRGHVHHPCRDRAALRLPPRRALAVRRRPGPTAAVWSLLVRRRLPGPHRPAPPPERDRPVRRGETGRQPRRGPCWCPPARPCTASLPSKSRSPPRPSPPLPPCLFPALHRPPPACRPQERRGVHRRPPDPAKPHALKRAQQRRRHAAQAATAAATVPPRSSR
jgi:hypothetical protein